MSLPADFHFSQGSLRDFLACPRRFQLRYLQRLSWPAVEAEPYLEREQHIQRGLLFHHLADQFYKRIPAESLTQLAEANGLADWWQSFLAFQGQLQPGERKSESAVSIHLEKYLLIAKFDLLIRAENSKTLIYDWKTVTAKPRVSVLDTDIQTRLYLLLAASAHPDTAPEDISISYWFAAFPGEIEIIPYSPAQMQRDRADILDLIKTIDQAPPESFVLTEDERQCRYCIFRSYCERGLSAPKSVDSSDYDPGEYDPESFDFEQVIEVAF